MDRIGFSLFLNRNTEHVGIVGTSCQGSELAIRIPAPLWAQWVNALGRISGALSRGVYNAFSLTQQNISTIKQAISFNMKNCKSEMHLKTKSTNDLLASSQKVQAVCTAIALGIRFSEVGKHSLWLSLKECQANFSKQEKKVLKAFHNT